MDTKENSKRFAEITILKNGRKSTCISSDARSPRTELGKLVIFNVPMDWWANVPSGPSLGLDLIGDRSFAGKGQRNYYEGIDYAVG